MLYNDHFEAACDNQIDLRSVREQKAMDLINMKMVNAL